MKEHLKLLGHRVRSLTTGAEGIVTSVSFDLNGCIMAAVHPGVGKDGKLRDSHGWFDTKGLTVLTKKPVMTQPDFVVVPGGHPLPVKL